MTKDTRKNITGITYNHLNLPKDIIMDGQTITYFYDANGTKLKKMIPGKETSYAGKFIYKDGDLQFFNTPEGYVSYENGEFNYIYNYVDHLGNIRLSYTDANQNNSNPVNLEIVQEKNYYPFGLVHKGYNQYNTSFGNEAAKRFGFGGKELQDENISGDNLDWYDFGARNYDAEIGRWMNVDPLAEKMRRHSPYNYAFDNPVYFIDPDGMAPWSEISARDPADWIKNINTGEVKWFDGTGNDAINSAANYWGLKSVVKKSDKISKLKNLGGSFFGPTEGNALDISQILDQQISYLFEVSAKINGKAGVNIGEHGNYNNITNEYLSSIFLGASFGKKQNNGSDISGLIWDLGGGDLIESKLPKGLISKIGIMGVDAYFSSQSIAPSQDKDYMDRVRAVNKFKSSTVKFIDMKTILKIGLHKF